MDLTGLAVHRNSVDVTLHNFSSGFGRWVFPSSTEVFGTNAVPESGNLAMMPGGRALSAVPAGHRRGETQLAWGARQASGPGMPGASRWRDERVRARPRAAP